MNTLQVAAAAPWWLHAGAALILFLHIAGGTVGMLSGAAALALRKGSRRHRLAGHLVEFVARPLAAKLTERWGASFGMNGTLPAQSGNSSGQSSSTQTTRMRTCSMAIS